MQNDRQTLTINLNLANPKGKLTVHHKSLRHNMIVQQNCTHPSPIPPHCFSACTSSQTSSSMESATDPGFLNSEGTNFLYYVNFE